MATEAPKEEEIPAGAAPAGAEDVAAPEEDAPLAPIIVKKIAAAPAGAHGGGWKLALADMRTGMMAFFSFVGVFGGNNESRAKTRGG